MAADQDNRSGARDRCSIGHPSEAGGRRHDGHGKDHRPSDDARLYERARALLVVQVGRYAHARQFKRMRKALRQLKGHVGRVRRDLRRHLQEIPQSPLRARVVDTL